jgi:7,8-dihydropterin-6-yl-methyl-4-(beta-D-ribofuranosyl)aminobenzene 5'-phosphate synthase
MLFGACNCAAGSSLLSTWGPLCAGGAGFVSAVIGAMVANARTAPARPLGGTVPQVDRLAVRMVTDNVVIQFVASEQRDGITIERRSSGNVRPDAPPRAALNGEWGLSMHAQSQRGDEVRNVLVDFGYTAEVLLNNLSILQIDPASFDALVLSHGHYDHFGGMVGFLAANKDRLKPRLPLFVGGEDCFCIRRTPAGSFGALDRRAIMEADLAFDGFGCFPEKMPAAKQTGGYIPDDFDHEIATTYLVKDKGLVVLTSCSHRGVINAVKQAQQVSGVDKVHAVIGGFHIVPPLGDDYIRRTIDAFREIDPDYLIPAHCTGDRFYDLARDAMGDKVIHSAVGTRFIFGA